MGCLGVGEAARGEQLIANQGQERMGIRTTSKKSWYSKEVESGIDKCKKRGVMGSRGEVNIKLCTRTSYTVYVCRCMLSANNINLCLG